MVRQAIKSRWFLIPGSLLLGGVLAATITGYLTMRHYERTFTEDLPFQALMHANAAAHLAADDQESALQALRSMIDARLSAYSIRAQFFASDPASHEAEFRNIATYLKFDPEAVVSAQTRGLLAGVAPFNDEELESSLCKSGIRMLARSRMEAAGTAE